MRALCANSIGRSSSTRLRNAGVPSLKKNIKTKSNLNSGYVTSLYENPSNDEQSIHPTVIGGREITDWYFFTASAYSFNSSSFNESSEYPKPPRPRNSSAALPSQKRTSISLGWSLTCRLTASFSCNKSRLQ